ncbi:UNVERIFIED_CONTAM: hypothetical protein K2H54_049184 [Gekko kuhli]
MCHFRTEGYATFSSATLVLRLLLLLAIQPCPTLEDSMGQLSPHFPILFCFFELFHVQAGIDFYGVKPSYSLAVRFLFAASESKHNCFFQFFCMTEYMVA